MLDPAALDAVLAPLLPRIRAHHTSSSPSSSPSPPFVLALSGLQGSGKSTWAAALAGILTSAHGLPAAAVSLDDFYRTHAELVALRDANPDNALWRARGQPGTHDEALAGAFFGAVKRGRRRRSSAGDCNDKEREEDDDEEEVRIPVFDKSLFAGQGDRLPRAAWPVVPAGLRVLIFEGWCLGFLPLSPVSSSPSVSSSSSSPPPPPPALLNMHAASARSPPSATNTLSSHAPAHLAAVDASLARYVAAFAGPRHFDALVHLATPDVANVYAWRLGQERAMRARNGGRGMSDDEVVRFVRGYMPAYEMYLGRLTATSFFAGGEDGGKMHLRVMLDADRRVCGVEEVV
jgi:D-glycerate 3-kinase